MRHGYGAAHGVVTQKWGWVDFFGGDYVWQSLYWVYIPWYCMFVFVVWWIWMVWFHRFSFFLLLLGRVKVKTGKGMAAAAPLLLLLFFSIIVENLFMLYWVGFVVAHKLKRWVWVGLMQWIMIFFSYILTRGRGARRDEG